MLTTSVKYRFLRSKIHSKELVIRINRSYGLISSIDFILFSLTMAYGIGRNIALFGLRIKFAEFFTELELSATQHKKVPICHGT